MTGTAVLVASVLLMVAGPLAVAGEYHVDAERSELVVRLFKGGLASAFAHDHVIRATEIEGALTWDPNEPRSASVEVRADARSLIADETELRRRYGLSTEMPEDKRLEVQHTMESPEQLDVAAFPEMSFHSESVSDAGGGEIRVEGTLTLHGRSKPVRFRTAPTVNDGVLTAEAEIDFRQSDFGIEPYSAMLGAVKNQDEAKLIVRLVAVAAGDTEAADAEAVEP